MVKISSTFSNLADLFSHFKYGPNLPEFKIISCPVSGFCPKTFGSEQTGYICSPFIGDVTDARVKMKCFHVLKYPDAGTDFFLDRYTGKFRIESYLFDRKESWWRQYTGICKGVEKKF